MLMFFIYLKVLLPGQLHLSCVFLGFPLSKLRPVVGYDGLDAHLVMHVGGEFLQALVVTCSALASNPSSYL